MGVDFLPVGAERASGAQNAEPSTEIEVRTAPAPKEASDRERRQALLDQLRDRHASDCPHCTRSTTHSKLVFGEGAADARLMFVGEAPGAEEDRTGRPFVGRAGELLDKMIRAMGLEREEVYIANVLKCRPPNNATPTLEEASRCGPYLLEQIRVIRPEAIVTLGKPASQLLLESKETMGAMRGSWREYQGVPLMPTFHPAYLLRAYTDENRAKVWSDLQQVMERLGLGR
ncbi:MAG: uracil-DNA glycosylase [Phycisphaeraceae bacterium]|nr:MAG: uracil-DNA glycosylase [Phycisphaeraceae bacterium]